MNIDGLVAENARRNAALAAVEGGYDPLSGAGAWGDRVVAAGSRLCRTVRSGG